MEDFANLKPDPETLQRIQERDAEYPIMSQLLEEKGVDHVIKLSRELRHYPELHHLYFDRYPNSDHPIWIATLTDPEAVFKLIDAVYDREFILLDHIDENIPLSTPLKILIAKIGVDGVKALLKQYEVTDKEFDYSLLD